MGFGKGKKSVALIIAAVLSALYMVYSTWYWFGGGAASQVGTGAAAQLGGAIAVALVAPHLVATFVAFVFNVLALFMDRAGFALVAGILYAVAMVLFIAYFMFVVIQTVLCFVAYAKMCRRSQATA